MEETTIRPGRGWTEAKRTGLPVESNYVMECLCGATANIATTNPKFAERIKQEHRFEHFKKIWFALIGS